LADAAGHLHPGVELQLGAPFRPIDLPAPPGASSHRGYLRVLKQGEEVYVLGRPRLATSIGSPASESTIAPPASAALAAALAAAFSGYRETPQLVVFSGEAGPLFIKDQAAYAEARRWDELPWYKKLSVLVRNR